MNSSYLLERYGSTDLSMRHYKDRGKSGTPCGYPGIVVTRFTSNIVLRAQNLQSLAGREAASLFNARSFAQA